ncbi:MAG: aminoacyl-tRNA hydrolase [Gammaproteobacteria bacterium]|nr:aminoacyl-tRNA hydrolase [Gammaproteobacteria bacterium]MBU1724740.1 aminoacyl-tRNA hydrolase [Gammaproteobacteria bacterium]MBU2005911.1 aminoacyl-tRNA hydrolase [Gammaproteobacteria bacterium]
MGTPIRLIAGLGNPGSQYDKTRHNAGFWFVDELARRYSGQFAAEKRFSGDVCKLQVGANTVWLIKPMTFMNRSGLAVRQLADFYRIPVEQILVAHDELDIAAGDVRLKQAGGHGGHNGLRDLHAHLGADYWRLRLGVGHPGDRSKVVDYVLSRPSADDEIVIMRAIDDAASQIELILQGDMQKAMQALHTR